MTPFDAVAATNEFLASVPADARARSDAYFEGGYWLQLIDYLVGIALAYGLLQTGLSRRMRDFAERRLSSPALRTLMYWVLYLAFTTAVLAPLSIYEGYFREHAYQLSNQTFGEWMADQGKGLAVGLIIGGMLVTALYTVVRKLERTWALWGAITMLVMLMFVMVIGPVLIAPLFNEYKPLQEAAVRDPILSMARAQGVPTGNVWVFDASKQSKRVSANVSGLGATLRVSLNDNLLQRCDVAQIEAVMGHEIGHYVLHHIEKSVLFFGIVIAACFALLRYFGLALIARFGERWGVRGVSDPAGLPLAVALFSTFMFVLTPINNTWVRSQEAEADLFGLNASGQPDGEAKVALMLGEYRKLDPGPIEEFLFFDHPSGRSRIQMAMQWKAEHMEEAKANAARAASAEGTRASH